jgi:hypothetical protein
MISEAQAMLSDSELLRATFNVGYFPPNTPTVAKGQKRHFALRQRVTQAPQKETSGWSLMGQVVIPLRAYDPHRLPAFS